MSNQVFVGTTFGEQMNRNDLTQKKPKQSMKELKKTSDMAAYFLREIHPT